MSKKSVPRVLDVGCAHGYLLEATQNVGCEVAGLEYSDYVVSEVIEAVRGKIKKGSIIESCFKHDEFDVVVCFNVLEYIPEGKVGIALNNLVKWTNDLVFFTTCFKHSRYSSQKHSPDELRMTIKTEKEWIEIFQKVGATHQMTFYDGGGGDVLVFRKKHDKRNRG
jgi:2-polyprenyl-3-methyl-5-hydroxy-6-metoxy-1,4-benzoquinol methylase